MDTVGIHCEICCSVATFNCASYLLKTGIALDVQTTLWTECFCFVSLEFACFILFNFIYSVCLSYLLCLHCFSWNAQLKYRQKQNKKVYLNINSNAIYDSWEFFRVCTTYILNTQWLGNMHLTWLCGSKTMAILLKESPAIVNQTRWSIVLPPYEKLQPILNHKHYKWGAMVQILVTVYTFPCLSQNKNLTLPHISPGTC